ncbi:MAG: hypothetical protein M3490_11500 [Chloroflexota bacterium]|nr:hypothetical protein [Chloroflexota bacterium]
MDWPEEGVGIELRAHRGVPKLGWGGADGVEDPVDRPGGGYPVDVGLDRRVVGGIDDIDRYLTSVGGDVGRERFEGVRVTTGEPDVRTLRGEVTGGHGADAAGRGEDEDVPPMEGVR